MINLISGTECQKYISEKNLEAISNIKDKLKLVVIRVGDDESSKIYINSKRKACEECNINFEETHFKESITENELIDEIKKLNSDEHVTSILVQLPLPAHINEENVINAIDYKKDVDGLTAINQGSLFSNSRGIIPCTAKGIIDLLDYYKIDLTGKKVTIIGRSNLVGKPLIPLLINKNATVTVCHSKTTNLKEHTLNSDIIIIAIGKANFLTKDYIKDNTTIIDVGINRLNNGITGDVDRESIKDMNVNLSPVPKGVGPMTIASVISNIIECYNLSKE